MPDLSALLTALKSPKTAFIVFIFGISLIFAPFGYIGINKPNFTKEYESFIIVAVFLSGAILAAEVAHILWRMALRPLRRKRRREWVEKTFLFLNLEELCVLWVMTQQGVKTIKGSSSNNTLLSLRSKGCLRIASGLQTINKLHHVMPDDIFDIVSERALDRMPPDFRNSIRFEDVVSEYYQRATDPWS